MKKRIQNNAIVMISNALRKAGWNFNEASNSYVVEMQRTIAQLEEKSITFYIEQQPDGGWIAQSTNIDGIMSGGNNPQDIPEMLKDAVFTYFEIPPQFCNDSLLRSDNEPIKVQQKVHVSA
jgi:predicted RNase H-like HicB family nuclease